MKKARYSIGTVRRTRRARRHRRGRRTCRHRDQGHASTTTRSPAPSGKDLVFGARRQRHGQRRRRQRPRPRHAGATTRSTASDGNDRALGRPRQRHALRRRTATTSCAAGRATTRSTAAPATTACGRVAAPTRQSGGDGDDVLHALARDRQVDHDRLRPGERHRLAEREGAGRPRELRGREDRHRQQGQRRRRLDPRQELPGDRGSFRKMRHQRGRERCSRPFRFELLEPPVGVGAGREPAQARAASVSSIPQTILDPSLGRAARPARTQRPRLARRRTRPGVRRRRGR